MSILQVAPNRRAPRSWGSTLQLIAGAALFWAVAAGLTFIAAPGLDSFGRLLVFSESNGLSMLFFALLLQRSRVFSNARPMLRWVLVGTISVPLGYVVGHVIALRMLGEPFRLLSLGHDRMVPVIFTVLIAGFGLYFFATRERLANEAVARSEAQRLAAESQLRLLRAQLQPHMIFNTLANLRSLVGEDSKQAVHMIDQLIVYLRNTLSASRIDTSTLAEEFTQLRAYLEIMSVRMGPRLTYRLELPPELESAPIPSMLLQPLVENAIKHGIEPKVGAGSIDVLAQRTADGVEISVVDTGLGLPPGSDVSMAADMATGSYGLLHVRERLQVLYGSKASLTLTPHVPSGFCAKVNIPT